MSKHPIQALDDLFKTTGMEFGMMAEQMREDSDALLAKAREISEKS